MTSRSVRDTTALAVLVASVASIIAIGGLAYGRSESPLPGPCVTEDQLTPDCYWDAAVRSNGQGRSFVVLDGIRHFVDGATP